MFEDSIEEINKIKTLCGPQLDPSVFSSYIYPAMATQFILGCELGADPKTLKTVAILAKETCKTSHLSYSGFYFKLFSKILLTMMPECHGKYEELENKKEKWKVIKVNDIVELAKKFSGKYSKKRGPEENFNVKPSFHINKKKKVNDPSLKEKNEIFELGEEIIELTIKNHEKDKTIVELNKTIVKLNKMINFLISFQGMGEFPLTEKNRANLISIFVGSNIFGNQEEENNQHLDFITNS